MPNSVKAESIAYKPLLLASLSLVLLLTPSLASAQGAVLDPERGVMTMAPLLDKVTPAVVSISVQPVNPADPLLRQFFYTPEPRRQHASGVVVDAKRGYVLTNHHVVDKADQGAVIVTLKDRRRLEAEVIGSDPDTDIALLKIPVEHLEQLTMNDSDTVKVGDIVFAIGNPFGLGQTVTSGMVSALGRVLRGDGYEDLIQTDAAINPGNSGGALVNSKGELVGINSSIISAAGGNLGIGFAVPTNMARAVMDQLARHGEVRRGVIGVAIVDLTPELAAGLKLKQNRGAVISRVQQGSPAERAGLEAGDIIIRVDNKPVRGSGHLRNLVGMVERGKEIDVTFIRNNRRRTLRVEVGTIGATTIGASSQAGGQLEGAKFSPIPSDHPMQGQSGVYVDEVRRASRAHAAGLRKGDVIVQINNVWVRSVDELRSVVSRLGRIVAFALIRDGAGLFIPVR
ncbi:MAG: Do family serine endopeptidase [Gammaproteobacteria bacterium]|nr:Do family serine endopeptidase [Gammaproteobacteria bacterium]